MNLLYTKKASLSRAFCKNLQFDKLFLHFPQIRRIFLHNPVQNLFPYPRTKKISPQGRAIRQRTWESFPLHGARKIFHGLSRRADAVPGVLRGDKATHVGIFYRSVNESPYRRAPNHPRKLPYSRKRCSWPPAAFLRWSPRQSGQASGSPER